MNYIGLDLGTSSVKGLLMSSSLEVLLTFSLDYPNNVDANGWSDQDPNDWYEKSIDVLKYLISNSNDKIASISFSGQMHGMVTLDENDNILRPAILWNDQRTTKECEYLNNHFGVEGITKLTGNIALTGYTAPKVLWMNNNEEELFNKINKIMLPKDYLSYMLTGSFATDYSDASGTLYLDVENRCWSKDMLDILDIKESQLPKLYNSFDKVGCLKGTIKEELNIDYDIDVVIGGGDQAVGAIGTATVNVEDINISLGTSGVVFSPQQEYIYDSHGLLHSFCDSTGKFHKMGVALNSGGSMNWWTGVIEDLDFKSLESKMMTLDPSEKLYFLPYLIGERSPINDSDIRGSFIGLSLHHKKEHLTRSIIEGVSFSIKQMYDQLSQVDNPVIKITGGGAKNKLWVQIIANVLNCDIHLINSEEGPAFGAALLAASYTTNTKVEELASNAVKITDTISPNDDREIYQQKYKTWLSIYPIIKNIKL